jgi:hypothetical protein
MSRHPDLEALQALSQQKLAEIYSEGIVQEIMGRKGVMAPERAK